jgi:ribosome maturation factor RimP
MTTNAEKRLCYLTKREEYEARAEKMLEPVMEQNHFELVDVEYVKEAGQWYLRAYVDKEGGITLNDCELVNRVWSDLMDQDDFIEDAYVLEVSSPGLGRQLKKEKDFQRSIGQDVDVHFYGSKKIPAGKNGKEVSVKEVTGTLLSYTPDIITLDTEFASEYEIPRTEISTVKLTIDFS